MTHKGPSFVSVTNRYKGIGFPTSRIVEQLAAFRTSPDSIMSPMRRFYLCLLLTIYAIARLGQAVPESVPVVVTVALHVFVPLAFALFHGSLVYGFRGALKFALTALVIGNIMENVGVRTGFPYGHYHFTGAMGPKLFQVPIMLGLAYIGMGYVSWTLARVIAGRHAPLLAVPIMVAWDLAEDPIWANFVHAWVWHDGGAYFGVPITNYLGWCLTMFIIYQVCNFMLRRDRVAVDPFPQVVILFYSISAFGNLLVAKPAGISTITDSGGIQWSVQSIWNASALVSIVVMGGFALLAWMRATPRTVTLMKMG